MMVEIGVHSLLTAEKYELINPPLLRLSCQVESCGICLFASALESGSPRFSSQLCAL